MSTPSTQSGNTVLCLNATSFPPQPPFYQPLDRVFSLEGERDQIHWCKSLSFCPYSLSFCPYSLSFSISHSFSLSFSLCLSSSWLVAMEICPPHESCLWQSIVCGGNKVQLLQAENNDSGAICGTVAEVLYGLDWFVKGFVHFEPSLHENTLKWLLDLQI